MTGIYKIENIINGKIYIGQAIDIEKRWRQHERALNGGYHTNRYMQNSWNKYGRNNFDFDIVAICEEDELDVFEVLYINKFDSFYLKNRNGYNLTLGGCGSRGWHLTNKHKEAISSFHKGKIGVWKDKTLSEDHKALISISLTGRCFSDTHKENLSIANTGDKNPSSKKVMCDGIVYGCIQEFCDAHELKRTTVSNWLNGKRTMKKIFVDMGLRYVC